MQNDIASISMSEARARMQAKLRVAFARTLIGPYIQKASDDVEALGLLPNHLAVLGSSAKKQLTVKSRKIAHSWGFSLFALAQCATSEKSQVTVGSYDEKEAQNKLKFLDWMYAVLPPGERRELGMSDGTEQRKFKNGSVIEFSARKEPTGTGGDFLGDEFSVEPPGKVTAAQILHGALGATTHKGAVRLGGTQRGEDTLFFQIASGEWERLMLANPLFSRLPSGAWEVLEFPWWLSPALCVDVAEAALRAPSMDTPDRVEVFGNAKLQAEFVDYMVTPGSGLPIFQREFECKVVAQGLNYFDLSEIESCYGDRDTYAFEWCEIDEAKAAHFKPARLQPTNTVLNEAKACILRLAERVKGGILRGEWGAALDIGRHVDKDELMLGHNLPEDRKLVALRGNIGMARLPFEGKQELFQFAMQHLPISRAHIDGTHGGIGVQLAEWGETTWPGLVSAYEFKPGVKARGSSNVKMRLQVQKLLMPWMPRPEMPHTPDQYRDLLVQMLAVKKMETTAGNILIDVERTKKHHGDKYWATVMLCDLFGEVREYQTGGVIVVARGGGKPSGGVQSTSRQSTLPSPRAGGNLPRRRVIV